MRRGVGVGRRLLAIGAWILMANLVAAVPAAAMDDEAMQEVLRILHEEGYLDEERHAELAQKVEERAEKRSWLDRISIWGDFRGRYENFLFERDVVSTALGERLPNRHRARYRARLNLSGEVNDHATVYLRIVSGGDDPRSTNQTLGRGVDFDTDDIRLDLAYVTLTPTAGGELCCIDDGYLGFDVGKVKNPFIWKALGMDSMTFDNDITPEGVSARFSGNAGPVQLFANAGFYVLDENSVDSAKDPQLLGGQLGGVIDLADGVRLGARGSAYHYFSLDDDFFDRAADGGNIIDGLARRNGSIQIVETSAFLELDCDLAPVLLFGSYAHNLSARSSLISGVGRNDDAFTLGLFVGDKKRFVKLGAAWFAIEANALPAMYRGQRPGGRRDQPGGLRLQCPAPADLQRRPGLQALPVWIGSAAGAAFVDSIPGSDRTRMQLDLKLKF